jgi:hypothetical protein
MYLRLVQKQNIEANRQVVNFAPVPLNLPLAKSFIIVRRWAKDVFGGSRERSHQFSTSALFKP